MPLAEISICLFIYHSEGDSHIYGVCSFAIQAVTKHRFWAGLPGMAPDDTLVRSVAAELVMAGDG